MCLAIYKPKGVQIKKRYLRNGFENNADGAGFAVARNGQLFVEKGFFTFEEFWRAFKDHSADAALIHFRYATHGSKSKENTHPFQIVKDNYAVIHNGIINIKCEVRPTMSDTWHFAKLVLEPLFKGMDFTHPSLRFVVEETLGRTNKVAVLRKDGKHIIYNEGAGEWCAGSWFSNGQYKSEPTRYANRNNTNVYGHGYGADDYTTPGSHYHNSRGSCQDSMKDFYRRNTEKKPSESKKKKKETAATETTASKSDDKEDKSTSSTTERRTVYHLTFCRYCQLWHDKTTKCNELGEKPYYCGRCFKHHTFGSCAATSLVPASQRWMAIKDREADEEKAKERELAREEAEREEAQDLVNAICGGTPGLTDEEIKEIEQEAALNGVPGFEGSRYLNNQELTEE